MNKREFDPFPQEEDPIRERNYAEAADIGRQLRKVEQMLSAACPNWLAISAELASISRRSDVASGDCYEKAQEVAWEKVKEEQEETLSW